MLLKLHAAADATQADLATKRMREFAVEVIKSRRRQEKEAREAQADAAADTSQVLSGDALSNPVVARCAHAYNETYQTAIEEDHSEGWARAAANKAYRQAMPPLTGRENIRDFIACVAHALLLDALQGNDATRLLYAAQIAHSTSELPAQPRQSGRPAKHDIVTNE